MAQTYKYNWVCEDTKDWTKEQRAALGKILIAAGCGSGGIGAYPVGDCRTLLVGDRTAGHLYGYNDIAAARLNAPDAIQVSLPQLLEIVNDEKAGDCLLPPKPEEMVMIDGKEWSVSSVKAALKAYAG